MSDTSEHINRIAQLFDSVSDSYDSVGVDFFQPIAHGLVQAINPLFGETWLDIGCGRGAVAQQAAEKLGMTGKMVGIDISEKMIENAKAMARDNILMPTEFFIDDAQFPQKITGEYDVISSCLVLFFLPNPMNALKTWRAFLKNSGRIGVTTFGIDDLRWKDVDQLFEKYMRPAATEAASNSAPDPFQSDQSMEELLSDAGFREVRTVKRLLPVKYESVTKWYEFSWSNGYKAAWLRVPEQERANLRAEAEALLMKHTEQDGSFTFNQEIRHTLALK